MMNKKSALALIIALSVPALSQAQQIDHAKVVEVTPITKSVRVSTPRQECWTEQVVHQASASNGSNGMLLGGILGGAIGNRFGRGNGNKAAIAAGAILGAALGQGASQRPASSFVTQEERCEVINDYSIEERLEGYKVKYLYNGTYYYTQMASYPGKTIPVRVSVAPAF